MRINIPVSVSELEYRNHNLLAIIIAFVVGFTAYHGFYASAVSFALVYVFRRFHNAKQKSLHYVAAFLGFGMLALHSGHWLPIGIGALVYITERLLIKSGKEVFWTELAIGIPYLYLLS